MIIEYSNGLCRLIWDYMQMYYLTRSLVQPFEQSRERVFPLHRPKVVWGPLTDQGYTLNSWFIFCPHINHIICLQKIYLKIFWVQPFHSIWHGRFVFQNRATKSETKYRSDKSYSLDPHGVLFYLQHTRSHSEHTFCKECH